MNLNRALQSCSRFAHKQQASVSSVWRQSNRHYAHHKRKASLSDEASSSRGLGVTAIEPVDVDETWSRLSLIQRQLKVAVADEDYALAAKLRDEQKVLLEALPPVQQYALGQVAKLRSGSVAEQLQTITNLAEAGEPVVIPDLAACLAVPELADAAEKAMWAIFMRARDPRVAELMTEGCSYMRSPGTYDKALAVFNNITQLQPSFVEGYNKRATVHYLMGRYDDSIADCQLTLQMQPYHFGAASGMGLCLLQLSRYQEALTAFEGALRIHPGMANIRRFVADLRRQVRADEDSDGSGL